MKKMHNEGQVTSNSASSPHSAPYLGYGILANAAAAHGITTSHHYHRSLLYWLSIYYMAFHLRVVVVPAYVVR